MDSKKLLRQLIKVVGNHDKKVGDISSIVVIASTENTDASGLVSPSLETIDEFREFLQNAIKEGEKYGKH